MMGSLTRLAPKLCLLILVLGMAAANIAATAAKTRYTETPNRELKRHALRLAKQIRELVYAYEKKDRELLAEQDRKLRPDSSGATANAARQQWLNETDALHDATMRKYKEQYWSDAILLANEILRRLPKQGSQQNTMRIYLHPTNVLGLKMIADHLELSAKSLAD